MPANDQPMKSSLLALVGDFFIDVYFLHGLSTDTLIDVKNIHFEKSALLAMFFLNLQERDLCTKSSFQLLDISNYMSAGKFDQNFRKMDP